MAQRIFKTLNLLRPSIQVSHRTSIRHNVTNLEVNQRDLDEAPISLPEDDKDPFGLDKLVNLEDLMEARVHFGHKEGLTNDHMRPYIFGKRLGVTMIDLEKTSEMLKTALNVTAEIAFRGGIILLMNPNRQTSHLVEETAKECGEYAYCRRWRSEVFTNSTNIFGAITRLPDLILMFSTISMLQTHPAVNIAAKMMIPTIGICDTNSNPTLITYMVPGNDDSPQSIELYCKLFKTAILNGKAKRKAILDNENTGSD